MKIVVGLGNPGRDYAATRHNLGFMVVERIFQRLNGTKARPRFRSELAEATVGTERLMLVMPQTYMNLSGNAVREVASWYRVPPAGVLVVLDDLDLPFGGLRLRGDGSAGGHNGLRSIVEQLGTPEVPRLRVGIGRSAAAARAQVLGRFTAEEAAELPAIVDRAADCCLLWATEGLIPAMNAFNQKPPPPKAKPKPASSAANAEALAAIVDTEPPG